MPPSDIAVSVRGLSKSYNIAADAQNHTTAAEAIVDIFKASRKRPKTETFWALRDVGFDIRRGDVVGIIGRNGAGKSTLLKILSRITEPTTGRIDLYGRVGSLLEVGTGFHPELTGRENVYLNGAMLGMTRREIASHFEEIVDFSEVGRFLDTPVKRYSSGMYVRLAFAVAAHLTPEILIVDEVLAVGDAAFQKKCLGKMQDVAERQGRTVIFVSHNMGPVRSLCSTVYWLQQGRVFLSGPSPDVVDAYVKEYTEPTQTTVVLQDKPRYPGMGERLCLHRIVFNGGGPLLHGERLTVRIEFQTQSALEGVVLGFGFSTPEGVRLITFESDVDGARMDFGRGVSGHVDVTVDPLNLPPGRYNLDVGARSGDNTPVDYVPASAQVEVLPGPGTPGVLYQAGGGVRLPADWDWSDVGPAQRRRDGLMSRLVAIETTGVE